ncbi:MAG: NAD-dependent epimerase/dehydratase family protein [Anaerolineae bacterium]
MTGGAGFIGSSLTDVLLKRGDEVIAIDNFNDYYSPARKRANVAPFAGHPRYTLYETDFRNRQAVEDIFAQHKPQAVAHIGAMGSVRYSVKHPHLYAEVNINGTLNVLDAAQQVRVENFIFASTSSVYGQTRKIPFVETDPTDRPLAPYPATKKAGEVLCHAYHNMHGLNVTALRFFNVYGPKGRPDMMPFMVMESLARNKPITLFDNGQMHRDWTHIDDIISGVVAAIDRPMGYEIINLGRGEPVLMSDFVQLAEEIVGKPATINVTPAPLSEPKITYANVDKARRLLDYNPQTSIVEGLNRFWAWYQTA